MDLSGIRAVILDADGVLTAGGIFYADDASELKRFDVHDGAGIAFLLRSGIQVAVLSGRECPAVEHRARQLGIAHVCLGAGDKLAAYERLLAALGLGDEAVCYVGDDLADLPVMGRVAFPVAVANARPEVKQAARETTRAAGGHGAVRELAERLLRAQGKWAAVVDHYRPRPQGDRP